MAGVGLYWRFEKWLRRTESRFDSMVSVTGCIAAVRRELFATLPAGTILDDVYWPLAVAMARPSGDPRGAGQGVRPPAREGPRRVSPQGPDPRRQFPVDGPHARGAPALAQPALVAVRLPPGLAAGGREVPAGVDRDEPVLSAPMMK